MKDNASNDHHLTAAVHPVTPSNARPAAVVSPAPVRPSPLLKFIVFFGGVSSIGAELATSRLIAPYFGSSTFIWASIIGVTLAFLSLGYWIGGRVADREPNARLLYIVTAIAAVAIAFIPLFSRPILTVSLEAFARFDAGAFYGALIAVLLVQAVPVTLLGFVTPYAIRLQLRDIDAAGHTAGSIYALSTLGSIAGSFLPVLLLIPWLGTTWTFIVLGLLLLIPSILGLLLTPALPAALVTTVAAVVMPFVASAAPGAVRPPEFGTLLTERESAYNYIQVVEQDGVRSLILNEGHAVHSIYDPEQLLTGGPWDYFMTAPLVVDGAGPDSVKRAMFIGLAGGTAARQLTAAYGPIPIDGVEIDPVVAEIGREYFGLDEMPNVNVIVEDGRYALRTAEGVYDLIGIDAYRQPYIPFQLTTREFFAEVAAHLTPTGVAVVNAGRTGSDYRLVDVIASTMRASFAHVYEIDVGRFNNTMVIGTNAPSSIDNLARNAAKFPDGSPAPTVVEWSMASGNPREVQPGGQVFSDDHAPVELVVDQIILDVAREVTGQ